MTEGLEHSKAGAHEQTKMCDLNRNVGSWQTWWFNEQKCWFKIDGRGWKLEMGATFLCAKT